MKRFLLLGGYRNESGIEIASITLGATLAGEVKKNVFNARTHNYKTVKRKALSNNHIPENVYDNLVKTVHKYLPLLHRYTELQKNC